MTILLPTDGSTWSHKAMGYAIAFARRHGARVVALHVLDRGTVHTPPEAGQAALQAVRGNSKVTGQRILQAVVEAAVQAGVAIDTYLRVGDPCDEIVRVGTELPADLIVMGANGTGDQGQNGGSSASRGSVATRVVRRARRPVLVMG